MIIFRFIFDSDKNKTGACNQLWRCHFCIFHNLAVTIQIPNLPENLSEAQIIQNLIGELGPRFAIYVISFFVIGVYWISYHQIFNHIVDSRTVTAWLTLVFLFFITLIPFAVDLQADYSSYYVIFILYALTLTFAGLLLT